MTIQERLSTIKARHLVFHAVQIGLIAGRRVNVLTKRGVQIGHLDYSLEWRCYILCPYRDTIWSKGCLDDVGKALAILDEPAPAKGEGR